MKPVDRQGKIVVVVGTVTNDVRIMTVPRMTVRVSCGYGCPVGMGVLLVWVSCWYGGRAMDVVAADLCTEVY